jgi:pimeloyl-ACP methyl ester carboxylesterase
VEGAGRPAILLHGIGMDWRVWQAQSRRLRQYFHLYMLDLRGHGESDKPARGYSLAHYAADVEEVLDGLQVSDAVLVGSSLGGAVAVAVEAPVDLVSHRVLVDPPLTGGPVRDPDMFAAILSLKRDPVPRLAEYLATSNPGAGRHYLTIMSEMWHNASDGVITDMLDRSQDYFDLDAALLADEAPTLLLQADPAMSPSLTTENARRTLELLPHGSLYTVEGAGHAIHAYRPAEFVDLVRRFADGDPFP